MSIKEITSFFDFEVWLERKQLHIKDLEQENIELTREAFRLRRENRQLKEERAKFINQIIALKKSPAATEDEITNCFYDMSVPQIFKGREQECQKK